MQVPDTESCTLSHNIVPVPHVAVKDCSCWSNMRVLVLLYFWDGIFVRIWYRFFISTTRKSHTTCRRTNCSTHRLLCLVPSLHRGYLQLLGIIKISFLLLTAANTYWKSKYVKNWRLHKAMLYWNTPSFFLRQIYSSVVMREEGWPQWYICF